MKLQYLNQLLSHVDSALFNLGKYDLKKQTTIFEFSKDELHVVIRNHGDFFLKKGKSYSYVLTQLKAITGYLTY